MKHLENLMKKRRKMMKKLGRNNMSMMNLHQ